MASAAFVCERWIDGREKRKSRYRSYGNSCHGQPKTILALQQAYEHVLLEPSENPSGR